MKGHGMLVFDAVCPACDGGCPYLELENRTLFSDGVTIETQWCCAKADMCKWLWERMREEVSKA